MTPDQLEKMEKWDVLMTLMGKDHAQRTADCWDSDDGEEFMDQFIKYEEWLERIREPNTTMQAILRSIDMGISSSDINDYNYHLDAVEEARRQEQFNLDEQNNKAIQKLVNKHNYKTYEHKRYKSHHCFEFDVNGVHVTGELWGNNYWDLKVRYNWVDGAGVKHKAKHNCACGSFIVPREFPLHWGVGDSTYSRPVIAQTIAHILTGAKSRLKLCKFTLEVPKK